MIPNEEIGQFKPGQSGNPNGRPRKWVSTLKEQGYKLSEINDALQVLMSMTEQELQEVYKNDKSTGLEKAAAGAIIKSVEKMSLYNLETILTRVFGKPKELTEATGTQKILVEYVNPNDKPILTTLITAADTPGEEKI